MKNLSRIAVGAIVMMLAAGVPLAAHAQTTIEKKEVTTTTSPSGVIVLGTDNPHTFTLQGQTKVYTAPPTIDLQTLNGKEVTVTTDANGNVTKVERKTTTTTTMP